MFVSSVYGSEQSTYLNRKTVLFPMSKTELAPLVNSRIKKYKFKIGEKFNQGDILVLLNKKLYKHNYLKAKTILYRTKEASKYYDEVYKDNLDLFKKNAVGKQELDKSKLNAVKAFSQKEEALSNYRIAEIKLNSCTIKAPFSGRVIEELKNEHDYVREGEPIIQIADDNKLLAAINLPSELITKINVGKKLKFRIDETDSECTGKVYSISSSVNPGSRTFEVKAVIDNKKQELRIGMSGILITEFDSLK